MTTSRYAKAARGDTTEDNGAPPRERGWRTPCHAFGCPEIGTISGSNVGPADMTDWLCRHHFGRPAHDWPEITRARRLALDAAPPAREPLDTLQRLPNGQVDVAFYREQLRGLRVSIGTAAPSKDWARRMRDREAAGVSLTEAQRQAWRTALGVRGGAELESEDANTA